MDCQHCGKKDALIHLTEIRRGEVHSLWLCPECARRRKASPRTEGGTSDQELFGRAPASPVSGGEEDDSLSTFLGEDGIRHRNLDPGGIRVCPVCGFRLEDFFRHGKLGCPGCYRAFEPNLRPWLARHHGRTIHLGKVPPATAQGKNPLAEMTRTRVALEKAVAAEDFEEAARLRDHLKALQARQHRQGDGP
jgi:protein arginine kinase activator